VAFPMGEIQTTLVAVITEGEKKGREREEGKT
jgi:hypothetical protein